MRRSFTTSNRNHWFNPNTVNKRSILSTWNEKAAENLPQILIFYPLYFANWYCLNLMIQNINSARLVSYGLVISNLNLWRVFSSFELNVKLELKLFFIYQKYYIIKNIKN